MRNNDFIETYAYFKLAEGCAPIIGFLMFLGLLAAACLFVLHALTLLALQHLNLWVALAIAGWGWLAWAIMQRRARVASPDEPSAPSPRFVIPPTIPLSFAVAGSLMVYLGIHPPAVFDDMRPGNPKTVAPRQADGAVSSKAPAVASADQGTKTPPLPIQPPATMPLQFKRFNHIAIDYLQFAATNPTDKQISLEIQYDLYDGAGAYLDKQTVVITIPPAGTKDVQFFTALHRDVGSIRIKRDGPGEWPNACNINSEKVSPCPIALDILGAPVQVAGFR